MSRLPLRLAALLLAALLSGCSLFSSSKPADVAASGPPPGIPERFHNDVSEVTPKAEEFCRTYGKQAKLNKVEPVQGGDKMAYFDCK